jgi:hypothetical protein
MFAGAFSRGLLGEFFESFRTSHTFVFRVRSGSQRPKKLRTGNLRSQIPIRQEPIEALSNAVYYRT